MTPRTFAAFWDIVAAIEWPKNAERYQVDRANIARGLNAEQIDALNEHFSTLRAELDTAYRTFVAGGGPPLNLTDSGYWDLLAHVIGCGEKEYSYALAHPLTLHTYKDRVVESFAYVLPDRDDLKSLEPSYYQRWARRLVRTFERRRRLADFQQGVESLVPGLGHKLASPLTAAYDQVIDWLRPLAEQGDGARLLEKAPAYEKALRTVERRQTTLMATLARHHLAIKSDHGWPCVTSARNLAHDLRDYRPGCG